MSESSFHRGEQLSMRVDVHGESIELRWSDGVLAGDGDIVGRVKRVAAEQGADLNDPAAALTCLELAVAMRPEVNIIE